MRIQEHEVLVDPDDEWRLTSERWFIQANRSKHRVYCYVRREAYKGGQHSARMLHREIAGAAPGQVVDHINGNTLDNRKANLRVCSHAENMRNRAVGANNKCGVKGVYFCRQKNKWRAVVRHDGKKHHAGYAESLDGASRLYDAKARELHGEFARPNTSEAVTA